MQNKLRDRLMEVLKKAEDEWANSSKTFKETAVDNILADGWIRPPCKVGDTVYVISRYYTGTWQIYSCTVEYITYYKSNGFINAIFSKDINFGVNITEFGKTVFLTKEQVEQKLKELSENGNL